MTRPYNIVYRRNHARRNDLIWLEQHHAQRLQRRRRPLHLWLALIVAWLLPLFGLLALLLFVLAFIWFIWILDHFLRATLS